METSKTEKQPSELFAFRIAVSKGELIFVAAVALFCAGVLIGHLVY